MWAIICGEKDNFLNSCSIASLCDNSLFDNFLNSSKVKQYCKNSRNYFFSRQIIAHINQHTLQKYAIKTKQTYQLLDGSLHHTSYVQNKHYNATS